VVALCGDEWKLLAGYIHSICGVQLDEKKQYLIESRLSRLLEQTGSSSYTGLYQKARMDGTGAIERSIINAITTGETSFFRDDAPYQLLRHKILPDLIDRRNGAASGKIRIRIWSAACSSGQEVYSIAMVLREVLGAAEKYDIRLIGTDISPEAVQRASLGVYNSLEGSRGIDEAKLSRYFTKQDGNWKVRDEIRAMASFRTVNLLRDFSSLGQFDIIFCRNVAIYFSDRDKASLFGRMEKSLASDGYLVIGATESLAGICPQLAAKNYLRAVFYQRGG
jgi:chemotaxis protein methyltransferase CheR